MSDPKEEPEGLVLAVAVPDFAENPSKDEEGNDGHSPPAKSIFTDESGNLKLVNLIVRRPNLIFSLVFASCIFSTWLLTRLNSGGNPFTEETNEYDLVDVRSVAYDSLFLANEDVEEAYLNNMNVNGLQTRRGLAGSSLEGKRDQEDVGDTTFWIYEAKTDDGLFTKEAIPIMRAAEGTIIENGNYTNYCALEYDINSDGEEVSECRKPLSAMNIFYASNWNSTLVQDVISELTEEKIKIYQDLAPCVEFNVQCAYLQSLPYNVTDADKEWVEATSLKINLIIESWDGQGDLNPDIDEVSTFMAYMNELETKRPYVNFFFDEGFNSSNPVVMFSRSIYYWGEILKGATDQEDSEKKLKKFVLDTFYDKWEEISSSNNNDEVKSFYFMGSLIWDIILRILVSDGLKAVGSLIAVFFYLRTMLGSWFLTAVGMFEMFMSLPLAWLSFSYIFQIKYFSALNILCLFIVMAIGADDIFVFMDAYKQSASQGKEVLSSMETRMSWVFRRSGSAMLLTSATTCAAFLCTLISPIAGTRSFGIFAAFVIFFDYALVMTLFCSAVVIYHDRFEGKRFCCNCTFWKRNDPTPTEAALVKHENGEAPPLDRISLFFKEKLGPFILKGRNRLIIGIVLLAWVVVACIYTSKLEPTTSAEQFLNEDHPLQKGLSIFTEEFAKTQEDENTKIYFVWGLEELDRGGVNQLLDPDFIGKASFVEDFSFNEDCQTEMLKACETLKTSDKFDEFILIKDGLKSVDCFVEEFGAYNALGDNGTCTDKRNLEWVSSETWQVSPSDLVSTMEQFVNTQTCYDNNSVEEFYDKSLGWDGDSLRYVGISVDSSLLDPRSMRAESEVRIHYDKFIEFAKELDKTMEDVCQSKTIMTDLDQKFIFMNNQRIYRTSAVTGSMLGALIAFVVIFISTRKLHISIFSTLCILCILVGVIGSVTMLGWKLGTIEAILISILAGFSVDYVIHLAHAYVHAEGDTDARVKAAYGDMGVSVFSGMLTSVVASIPLFFCTLTFFAKFGTFLCLTIVLSWIFANFGFMCLLAQFKIPMTKNKWW